MAKSNTKDMSVGSPTKLIIGFAFPLLLGMLFQQIYGLMDTVIVGRFLGVSALAAVGSTGSINFFIVGFCLGVCNGFALPIAQQFGAKQYDNLKKYVGNSAILSVIIAILMSVVTVILCRNILIWMQTPDDIIDQAYNYIVVIFIGIPATMLYNLLSGYLRSLGNSTAPLVFLVISAFLNIFLDILFITTFNMGVFGAALATVISQLISGLLSLLYIALKVELLHPCRNDWSLSSTHVKNLLYMGFPMGFQYSITAIGSVVLQTAVNTLGSTAVASMTAASRITMFASCPYDALGSTMATYGGQNVGAGTLDRLKKGISSSGIIGTIYSALALITIYFFGKNMVGLFVDAREVVVIDQAYEFLVINAAFYLLLLYVNVVRFMIQGMGCSGFAMFAGIAEMIGRGLIALVFVPIFGFRAACFASPLAWLFADTFLFPAFFAMVKKLERQQKS